MRCFVYRSTRRPDTFVYLPREEGFDDLPEPLRALLGRLELALEIELTPERKLARCDTRVVLAQIEECGYYLQLPPSEWTPA